MLRIPIDNPSIIRTVVSLVVVMKSTLGFVLDSVLATSLGVRVVHQRWL